MGIGSDMERIYISECLKGNYTRFYRRVLFGDGFVLLLCPICGFEVFIISNL